MLPIDLAGDVNTILGRVVKLIQAFVDVVSSEGWLKPALAAMELSQMLIQGQWDSDPVLMQVPHFNEDIVGRLHALEPPVKGVFDILEMEDDVRESALGVDQQQMSDIALFCNAYPNIDVEYVVDAEEVSPGDVVTVSVILRRDVEEDDEEDIDALGEVVSYRYSHKKRECWWLVVGDKATNTLLSIKRVSFTAATKTKLKFNAPESQSKLTLYLISDSYIGCDQEYPFDLKVGASMETE
jgi:pre-mRNA-splicing helicase BRR2